LGAQEPLAARPLRRQPLQQKQRLDLDSQAPAHQRVPLPRQPGLDLEERQAHKVPLLHPKLSKQITTLPNQNRLLVPLERRPSQVNLRLQYLSLDFPQLRNRRRRVRHNPQTLSPLSVRLEAYLQLLRRNLIPHLDFQLHLLSRAKHLPSVVLEGPTRQRPLRQFNPASLQWTHQPSSNPLQPDPRLLALGRLNLLPPPANPLNPSRHLD
jgi:hypothetical protein